MHKFAVILWIMASASSALGQNKSKPDPLCLAQKCGLTMMGCGAERECRSWLQCVIGCGEDKIRCPSFCGFYYQSKRINATNLCIFKSQCVDLGFSEFADYKHGDRPRLNLADVSGTYWFAASHGGPQIFDFDCQRFDFSSDPNITDSLKVKFQVPLKHKDQERMTGAEGVFRPLPDGAIEVVYENFAGYHEKWYLVAKTEHTLLARVCIGAETVCYDYGTVVLSKTALAELEDSEVTLIDDSLRQNFGLKLADFKASGTTLCPNR